MHHRPASKSALTVARRAAVGAIALAVTAAACNRERAPNAATTRDAWPGYNNGPDGQRFSSLTQIDTGNVARLKTVCELKLGEEGPFQAGPVVVGNMMYVTTAHTTVAMNAANCGVRWRHVDSTGVQDPISVNRGVAYLDGRIFRGMPGSHLAALDATTGKELWTVKIGDLAIGEFVSSAPIAWNGIVMVGLAGGDWGIRGRVMGYDAATGKELWRFNTVPMGSERGAETWHIPETAARGGGAQWTAYTLDTLAGELFVPVGNPAPDFAPDARPGDNLYTNSIVVLDAKTGALKWWFQATPRDGFDYDLGAAPMLYATQEGEARVAIGSKDGHVYGVNRTTHVAAFKTPVTTIFNADKKPTPEGVRACPGPLGGVEWNGPAFDPASHTIYVGSVDWCATFTLGTGPEVAYKAGDLYMGTGQVGDPSEQALGWVTDLDGTSGAVRWKFQTPKPVVAGVTPTAGGLLFTGDLDGNFYAFNKADGRVLFTTRTGGAIAGGVITYMVDGKQYVATTSGNVSRSTFQTAGSPRLVVMAVDARTLQSIALPEVSSRGVFTASTDSGAAAGQQQYEQFCAGCHGTRGEGGGSGPSLLREAARQELTEIVAFVKNPKPPMPKLHPSPLSDEEVTAVSQYVQTLQRSPR